MTAPDSQMWAQIDANVCVVEGAGILALIFFSFTFRRLAMLSSCGYPANHCSNVCTLPLRGLPPMDRDARISPEITRLIRKILKFSER